jgi:hypothetical protein
MGLMGLDGLSKEIGMGGLLQGGSRFAGANKAGFVAPTRNTRLLLN